MTIETLNPAVIERDLQEAIDNDNLVDITVAEWQLDAILHPPRASLHASALWYAAQGLPVFPLWPDTKHPMTGHGVKDATTNPDQIHAWWTTTPTANIGAAMGITVDLIDIDGLIGHRSLRDNPTILDGFEIVGRVHTPRPGGVHLYIPATGDRNSGAGGMLPGVDYKGHDGYALVPPSHTVQPEYRGHYRFLLPPQFPRPTA